MTDSRHPSMPLTGSFGSTFWQIRVHPDIVPELAEKFDWNRLGGRVIIDPLQGLIAWMTPTSEHAGYAAAADRMAERAGGPTPSWVPGRCGAPSGRARASLSRSWICRPRADRPRLRRVRLFSPGLMRRVLAGCWILPSEPAFARWRSFWRSC